MADDHYPVIFEHRLIKDDLRIQTGANQITWSYGLNTAVFPTYGGEVVQVLSAYTDNLVIQGEINRYRRLEEIYKWFLRYMQISTQAGGFHDEPVKMRYPTRGWEMKIKPMGLPGFRLGTDVVAPTWQLEAHIVEQDRGMVRLTMQEAAKKGFDFGTLHAGIGYDEDNPFTDPAARKSKYDPEEQSRAIGDFYQNLIPAYLEGDFETLYTSKFGSKPADYQGNNKGNKDGKQEQDSKKKDRSSGTGQTPNAESND